MAKTFKIAVAPTFKATVKIPRVGDAPMEVPFVFKTMNRKELAKMYTRWNKEQQDMLTQANEDPDYTLEDLAEVDIKIQARQVKDIVHSWGFDEEFNDENIEALVTTALSVSQAITECYSEAYEKARLGN